MTSGRARGAFPGAMPARLGSLLRGARIRGSGAPRVPAADKTMQDLIAAIDLGSNSFHMVVARYHHGQLTILDRLREMVRLAGGLDDQGRLSREATDRALAALDEDKRAVFVMFELEELSCVEIASMIGVPVGTVYSRLHAARAAFARSAAALREEAIGGP